MEHPELKSRAVRGIFALTSRSILLYVIKIAAFTALGIFLDPSQIGIFLVVSATRDILALFSDVGLGPALVQKHEDPNEEEYSSTFFIQESLVVGVFIVGWFFAGFVGRQLQLTSDGVDLYKIILVTIVINSFKAIPSIRLERKLAFDKQVIPQIVEELVFNSLVVFLAWKGFGIGSYSISVLVSAFLGLIAYYLISPWWPSLQFSWKYTRQLLSYGIQFQGKSYLAVVKDQLLTLLLTKMVGTSGIGYWGWAQRYAYSPFRFIADNVTKVAFPAYSRLQHDKEILGKAIEKSLFGVSFTLFPILSLMMVGFGQIVQIVSRLSKWEPAIPSFYLLCLAAGLSALSNILVSALDATGRVKTTLGLMVFWIALTWSSTVFLVSKIGFTGISAASLVVASTLFITVFLVKKQIPFKLVRNTLPFVLFSLLAGTTSWFLSSILPHNLIFLVLALIFGALAYLLLTYLFKKEEITANVQEVVKSLRNEH